MEEKEVKYWEKRKAQRMWEYMQSAEDTAAEIEQAYWKASGYINNQLDTIFNRFKAKHNLSNAEARRLLNMMQDRSSIDEFRSLLKQGAEDEEKKELLKMLESQAYSARIQRFQELQQEIDVLMKNQYHLEKERSTRHYADLASESYYKSIYDIQKHTGLAFSFAKLSPKKIDRLLKSKWSGINYSARIWNNTDKLAKDLKEELLLNLITGRSDREVAEIISNKFGAGAMEARRLVRTESNFIAGEMEAQSYEECDLEWYLFIATLDKKTSKICQRMDGKKFKVKDRQPGKNCHPMHPWCRSTTIAYLNDEVLENLTRRARDPETGKLYKIPANMSYPEWYEKKVAGDPRKVNAIKAGHNSRIDKAQYERYKSVFRNDETFVSFEKFQDMKYNEGDRWKEYKDTFKITEMKNFISDSGYEYLGHISNEEMIVRPIRKINVSDFKQHAKDNLEFKIDRKDMTLDKTQGFVDNAKLVLFQKSRKTFKFLANDGYCVLNEKDILVTAVPQKWRKKYNKYLERM